MIYLYCYCAVSLVLFVYSIPMLFRSKCPLCVKLLFMSWVVFWLPFLFLAACIGAGIWVRRGINDSFESLRAEFRSIKTALKQWWNHYE